MSKLSTISLASAIALFALPAMAADPAHKTGSYAAPLPFSWSGAYIGGHGGLSFTETPNPFADRNGLTGGLQAGYNLQFGPGVVGAEIEGSYLGGAEHEVWGGTIEERWRGAVKARGGFSFDRTLVFGTVGYAMTKFSSDEGLRGSSEWKGGYLFGGGVEQGLAGGLSVKMEYNYVTTSGVKTNSAFGSSETDIGSHVLKGGINYRF